MEVVVAFTLWALFAAFLTFPLLGLPELMQRAVATLLGAEFIAFGIWHFGSEGCIERPCAAFAETGRTAASLDIPALAVLLFTLAVAIGLRRHRLGRP